MILLSSCLLQSIALKFKDDSNFQKMVIARTLKMYNAGVSITKTADEWLFTGYVDPFLSLGNLLSKFNKDMKIPYDRVGYLYTVSRQANHILFTFSMKFKKILLCV